MKNGILRALVLALAVGATGCDWLLQASGGDSGLEDSRVRDSGTPPDPTDDGSVGDARPGAEPDLDFGVPEQGSEEIEPGESTAVGPVTITANAESLTSPITIEATVAELPAPLPEGMSPAGHNVDIRVSDQDAIVAPLTIQLHFDPDSLAGDEQLAVVHYDEVLGYQPLELLEVDAERGLVTTETRSFSNIAAVGLWLPPATHETGFDPAQHAWPIPNVVGGPVGGTCMGMTSFAAWSFSRGETPLHNRFTPSVARLLAIRAQVFTSAVWREAYERFVSRATPADFVVRLRTSVFAGPTVFSMQGDASYDAARTGRWSHAVLLIGYDRANFFAWDPELPDERLRIPYTASGRLGPQVFNARNEVMFTIAADATGRKLAYTIPLPGIGTNEDFQSLLDSAAAGFPADPDLVLSAPEPDLLFSDRVVEIRGNFSGSLNPGSAAYVLSQGIIFPLLTVGQSFGGVIPAFSGPQSLYVLVAPTLDRASPLVRSSAVQAVEITNEAPLSQLVSMITWAVNADVDLYVIAPDGTPLYLLNQSDAVAGELGLSSADGSTPEYVYVSEERGHTVMPGEYIVRAHLYSDERGAGSPPVQVRAHLTVNERTGQPRYWRCDFPMSMARSSNSDPNAVGPDWVDIASVNVQTGEIVSGYIAGIGDLCH